MSEASAIVNLKQVLSMQAAGRKNGHSGRVALLQQKGHGGGRRRAVWPLRQSYYCGPSESVKRTICCIESARMPSLFRRKDIVLIAPITPFELRSVQFERRAT
jgi:hypothetical protein